MPTKKKYELVCLNENCEKHDEIIEKYCWSDQESDFNCDVCDNPLADPYPTNQSVGVLFFKGLSPQKKQAFLKKRSREHFKRTNRELYDKVQREKAGKR